MGGGAIRTVAKAATLAGYRSAAVRRATLPTASTVHVAVDGEAAPLIASISLEKADGHPAMSQWPAWEFDDWEFAGGEDDAMSSPRLVFGPTPTLEEAKEATADLKEAIETVYFSSGNAEDSLKVNQVSESNESAALLPSVPKQVVQAFSLLQGSPEAQSVVASLACDKNVWDAVMKNHKVLEFCTNSQSVSLPSEMDVHTEESIGENLGLKELFSETVESPVKETSESSVSFVQSIKVKVSKMVSNISYFLRDFMGATSEGHGATNTTTSTSTNSSADYVKYAVGPSFIALAIAAILVILVKRG